MHERATDCAQLVRGTPAYPRRLEAIPAGAAPSEIAAYGNTDLLDRELLALFSSIRTPPDLVLRSLDMARLLRREVSVVSGFQSPMERECLSLLLRGAQPIVVCLSRRLEGMRIPPAWRDPIRDGRMVIVSPLVRSRRPTIGGALIRNRLVAGLATRVMIIHARAGSRTYRIAASSIEWGKPVYCFAHERNDDLIVLGARPVTAGALLNAVD